jgi:predicted acetyltransferase
VRGAAKTGSRRELVRITADEDNPASWKVIERNGGRREEGSFLGISRPFRRYRVATTR